MSRWAWEGVKNVLMILSQNGMVYRGFLAIREREEREESSVYWEEQGVEEGNLVANSWFGLSWSSDLASAWVGTKFSANSYIFSAISSELEILKQRASSLVVATGDWIRFSLVWFFWWFIECGFLRSSLIMTKMLFCVRFMFHLELILLPLLFFFLTWCRRF